MQGMLSIGAALLGAAHVVGVDIDADAIETAQNNCVDFDEPLKVCCRASFEAGLLDSSGLAPCEPRFITLALHDHSC